MLNKNEVWAGYFWWLLRVESKNRPKDNFIVVPNKFMIVSSPETYSILHRTLTDTLIALNESSRWANTRFLFYTEQVIVL